MATNFQLRLLVIVPVNKVAAIVGWFQANVGANAVPSGLGPPLNATGSAQDPATFNWMYGTFVDADMKAILIKLCQLASVTPPTPAQWAGWTKQDKITWLQGVQAALLAGYGVYVRLCGNPDVWDDPSAVLTAAGLQRMP